MSFTALTRLGWLGAAFLLGFTLMLPASGSTMHTRLKVRHRAVPALKSLALKSLALKSLALKSLALKSLALKSLALKSLVPIQRRADFIPLGVYWPGPATFRDAPSPAERWRLVDHALAGMAKHHINAVWMVNESTAQVADFARHAGKYGIYMVAATNDLSGVAFWIRRGDHVKIIAKNKQDWGNAPPPIAWGLGDEPSSDIMPEMSTYAADWLKDAPGEPITTVDPWNDLAAAGKVPFTMLASDIYPFFSPGNPLGFSLGSAWAPWLVYTRQLVSLSPRPWMMGQSFQEAIGPFTFDPAGNMVYLPGSTVQWVMPTPAQIRWQAWSAFALGAKGMFYFDYGFQPVPNPQGKIPDSLSKVAFPTIFQAPMNSGSPQGLVYRNGQTTPQYEALGEAFQQIARLAPVLFPLKPAVLPEVNLLSSASGGTVAAVLIHPQTHQRYLLVVAPYTGTGQQSVAVQLGAQMTALRNMLTGKTVTTDKTATGRQAVISLPPGDGALFVIK